MNQESMNIITRTIYAPYEPMWLPETRDEDYTNEFGTCRCDKLIPVSRAKLIFHLTGCPIGDEKEYRTYYTLPWYKRLFAFNPRSLYY